MIGSSALENMIFTSETSTWITLENTTEMDRNGLCYDYLLQLCLCFISYQSTALFQVIYPVNGSMVFYKNDRIKVSQGGKPIYSSDSDLIAITDNKSSSNTIIVDG